MLINGHIALITGAGQGIGRASSIIFASKGADLVLFDKNPETLNVISDEVARMGRKVMKYLLKSLMHLRRINEGHDKKRHLHAQCIVSFIYNPGGHSAPGRTTQGRGATRLELVDKSLRHVSWPRGNTRVIC